MRSRAIFFAIVAALLPRMAHAAVPSAKHPSAGPGALVLASLAPARVGTAQVAASTVKLPAPPPAPPDPPPVPIALDPVAYKGDPAIVQIPFHDGQIYRITSTGLTPVQLVFTDGEQPILIAGELVSTSQKTAKDWYAFHANNMNMLLFEPLHIMAPSICFVTTEGANGRPGQNYTFELTTRPGNVTQPGDGGYVKVEITYPDQIAAAKAAAWKAQLAQAQEQAAHERLEQARLEGSRNWRYLAQGSQAIQPLSISDNGQSTILLFAPNTPLPAPYVVTPDGKEAIVQTTNETSPDGLLMIMHRTTPEIVLRRGKQVLALYNQGYSPIGSTNGTGTDSPDVVREVAGQ